MFFNVNLTLFLEFIKLLILANLISRSTIISMSENKPSPRQSQETLRLLDNASATERALWARVNKRHLMENINGHSGEMMRAIAARMQMRSEHPNW